MLVIDILMDFLSRYQLLVEVRLMRVRQVFLVVVLFWAMVDAGAQNLVTDPGFEKRAYCPTNFNQQQLRSLKDWRQASDGTPDHYDRCSSKMGVPKNFSGEQEAFEGDGYAGLITYNASTRNYREYIFNKLSRPLNNGELLCVEVRISHAEMIEVSVGYSTRAYLA